jgi:Tfp pilus assembly protein PilN
MIQFNLLPDVKLEYVKTQRTKRFLTLVSVLVSVVGLALLVIAIVFVDVVQKKSLSDENNDITRYSSQLRNIPNLNKILTVQNQLSTLTSLHDQKPVTSRLFNYVSEVTPPQASLDQLAVDFATNTITFGGSAPSLDVVSTFTDTLKATTYSVSGSGSKSAFTDVVLASFGRDQNGASFTISCSFDPAIFNTDNSINLTVPQGSNANLSSVFQGGN